MLRSSQTYHGSMRVLLEGISGVNYLQVAQGTGISRQCIARFVRGERDTPAPIVERIAMHIWRGMNRNVLISPEDLQ